MNHIRKVTYVLDSLQTGGAEKSTIAISKRLEQWEPNFIYLKDNAELLPEINSAGIGATGLGIRDLRFSVSAMLKLYKLLKSNRPDLVVGTLYWAELYSRIICWMLDIPYVGTFVSDSYSVYRFNQYRTSGKVKLRMYQMLDSLSAKLCSAFIANSQAVKLSNSKALNIPLDNIKVIHRGRDVSNFNTRLIRKTPTAAKVFITVGRLIPTKNHLDLIHAFNLIHSQELKELTLQIVGDGPFRKNLESTINSHHILGVELMGNKNCVNELLATADVFIFCSSYEGFSGALVEAMLAGIPIICSDTPTNREVVVGDMYATLYPLGDIPALAAAMKYVSTNLSDAYDKARLAKEYALNHYDIDKVAASHDATYSTVFDNYHS